MLNTEHFILLAGNPEHWDTETRERVAAGESLPDVQVDQASRGQLSAHMVLSLNGWTVRYASGLQDRAILHKSGEDDPRKALEWGTNWANENPANREFYVSKFDIESAERRGADCSCLWEKVATNEQ